MVLDHIGATASAIYLLVALGRQAIPGRDASNEIHLSQMRRPGVAASKLNARDSRKDASAKIGA